MDILIDKYGNMSTCKIKHGNSPNRLRDIPNEGEMQMQNMQVYGRIQYPDSSLTDTKPDLFKYMFYIIFTPYNIICHEIDDNHFLTLPKLSLSLMILFMFSQYNHAEPKMNLASVVIESLDFRYPGDNVSISNKLNFVLLQISVLFLPVMFLRNPH